MNMEIEIPPRKQHHQFSDEEAMLNKFLPSGGGEDSESDDPYSSEHFRMYEFKVRRCTRSRSHDWTECPFAHPGEKARRRDPRRHHYSGAVCPDFRRGGCARGDACEFAHGVFECWLHPARYRTEACKDGRHCTRKVCFFAHSPRQLRILPPSATSSPPPMQKKAHSHHGAFNKPGHHCCVCSHHREHSPTSHLSPPMSPLSSVSYKDALTDLMSSLEAMHFGENSPCSGSPMSRRETKPWLDISPFAWSENSPSSVSPMSSRRENKSWLDISPFGYNDEQSQFVLSPSSSVSVSPGYRQNFFAGKRYGNGNGVNYGHGGANYGDDQIKKGIIDDVNGGSIPDPDLGWVNELLM